MDAISLAIAIVVSACHMPTPDAIKAKQAELSKQYPAAKITVRVDKKCLK